MNITNILMITSPLTMWMFGEWVMDIMDRRKVNRWLSTKKQEKEEKK